jgi:hypothetical protein
MSGTQILHRQEHATCDLPRSLAPYQILKAFDEARRDLAVTLCGSEGAFVGFHSLELSPDPSLPEGPLIVTAVLLDQRAKSHEVEYTATVARTESELSPARGRQLVARGRGTTLALDTKTQTREHDQTI